MIGVYLRSYGCGVAPAGWCWCLYGCARTARALARPDFITNEPQTTRQRHDSASFDNTVKLWDVEVGKCVSTLARHPKVGRSGGI